jgi:hypothetical protein
VKKKSLIENLPWVLVSQPERSFTTTPRVAPMLQSFPTRDAANAARRAFKDAHPFGVAQVLKASDPYLRRVTRHARRGV